jgi:hypothetical protein
VSAAALRQRRRGAQAHLAMPRLIENDEKILDRHDPFSADAQTTSVVVL